MTISHSIEEENTLRQFMWDMLREEDEVFLKSAVEGKFFQICVLCPSLSVRECSEYGCFLLRKGDLNLKGMFYNITRDAENTNR